MNQRCTDVCVILVLTFLSCQVTEARRCEFSSNYQSYCGVEFATFNLTANECKQQCQDDTTCALGYWHPPRQIWHDEKRPVCLHFKSSENKLQLCSKQNDVEQEAKMIRCSNTDVDVERCFFSDNFQRHCGKEMKREFGKSPEFCRQKCNDLTDCYVSTWHQPYQIWGDEKRPVCFFYPKAGAQVCPWGGAELIASNQNAQMIRCKKQE